MAGFRNKPLQSSKNQVVSEICVVTTKGNDRPWHVSGCCTVPLVPTAPTHTSKCWAPLVLFHAHLEVACVWSASDNDWSAWEHCLMSSVGRNLADHDWEWQNGDLFLILALLVCRNKADSSLCSSALWNGDNYYPFWKKTQNNEVPDLDLFQA